MGGGHKAIHDDATAAKVQPPRGKDVRKTPGICLAIFCWDKYIQGARCDELFTPFQKLMFCFIQKH